MQSDTNKISGGKNLSISSPHDNAADEAEPVITSLFDWIFFSNSGTNSGKSVKMTLALKNIKQH